MADAGFQVEQPRDACVSILHYLAGERDVWRRDLLLADFANHASQLAPEEVTSLDRAAIESCLPGGIEPERVFNLAHEVERPGPKEVDLVIATVTPLERRAAQDVFEVDENDFAEHDGRRYYELRIPSAIAKRDLTVALTSIMRPLNVVATKSMFEIRTHFQGQAYFLLGIAAGHRDRVQLGDVIVPELIHYYPPGRRLPEESLPRPGHSKIQEDLRRNINYYDPEGTDYFERLAEAYEGLAARDIPPEFDPSRKPKVVLNNTTLASGEQLIQDGLLGRLSEQADERIIAGDQEAFGFAEALDGSRWGIFRGISDYGEKEKPNTWQYVAVYAAGLALRDFLENQFSPKAPSQF